MLEFKIKETENYKFHYLENSLAEKEIDLIIEEQEHVIKDLQNFFNVNLPFKIEYYLLNSAKQVGKYYGDNIDCNGFARYPNKIYAVYSEEVKCIGYHEDAHIVSDLIGNPNSSFITEGIAMYFDKIWWGEKNEDWVVKFIKDGSYISITDLMYNQEIYLKCEITYPTAGAFTKFLIDTYGKENFIRLYKYEDINDNIFITVYNKTLEELEEQFLNYIKH